MPFHTHESSNTIYAAFPMDSQWAFHGIFSEAMGQVLSDTCGVAFGGTIEAAALKLGLPLPNLTDTGLGLLVDHCWFLTGWWWLVAMNLAFSQKSWEFGTSILFSQKYWVAVIIPIDELHHFSEGWPWPNPTNQLRDSWDHTTNEMRTSLVKSLSQMFG